MNSQQLCSWFVKTISSPIQPTCINFPSRSFPCLRWWGLWYKGQFSYSGTVYEITLLCLVTMVPQCYIHLKINKILSIFTFSLIKSRISLLLFSLTCSVSVFHAWTLRKVVQWIQIQISLNCLVPPACRYLPSFWCAYRRASSRRS